MYDSHFMHEAIALSQLCFQDGKGGPFGAVIVKEGQIIGRGHNMVTVYCDPTAHAEMMAIREACKNLGTFQLNGCDIYTSCEPCPMCFGAIYWARLSTLYFAADKNDAAQAGFDDSFIYSELNKPYSKRKIITQQFDQDKALITFDKWKVFEQRIDY